jgi:hypothetical protein
MIEVVYQARVLVCPACGERLAVLHPTDLFPRHADARFAYRRLCSGSDAKLGRPPGTLPN